MTCSSANTSSAADDRLRLATEAAERKLAGRPPWKMTRQDCMHLATLAADCLRARGATRVLLFGSLARGRALGVHSDFDLAMEGLSSDAFFETLGGLLQLLPLPTDLVELESASPTLRGRIMQEGIPI